MADSPFHNPFSKLNLKREDLPEGKTETPRGAKVAAPRRAVLRMERKGRGGKEVTVVEQLEFPPAELEKWLKALKQSLGCGGALEENTLVLQGDHRERVEAWLRKKGVDRISVG